MGYGTIIQARIPVVNLARVTSLLVMQLVLSFELGKKVVHDE